MIILADTHIHVYPAHDAGALFTSAGHAFKGIDGAAEARMLFLTEARGVYFWKALSDGTASLSNGWTCKPTPESGCVVLTHEREGTLYVFAGRQIVTLERLEVLALTLEQELVDGQPIVDVINEVNRLGGVPVLAWAPGKWFGARGQNVSSLMDQYAPDTLLLGDSSLRPTVWREPDLMRSATAQGYRVLAGSDPLPMAGEEVQAGRYAIRMEADFDAERPVTSIRDALRNSKLNGARVGRRNGPWEMISRMLRHRQSKKAVS